MFRWLCTLQSVPAVCAAVLLFGADAPADAAAASTPFAGRFKGEELTVELSADRDGYAGFIGKGGEQFPLKAQEKNGRLSGVFESGGEAFHFIAVLEGGNLVLVTGGTTNILKRTIAANPLATPPLSPPAKSEKASVPAPEADASRDKSPALSPAEAKLLLDAMTKDYLANLYVHPQGVMFRYPAKWKMDDSAALVGGLIVLIPDDVNTNALFLEEYLVSGASAAGLASIKDPQLEREMEINVAATAPYLRREGKTEEIVAGMNTGILMRWKGTEPEGRIVEARYYMTIIRNQVISLVAKGPPDLIRKRESVLRAIFATFDTKIPPKAPAAVPAKPAVRQERKDRTPATPAPR